VSATAKRRSFQMRYATMRSTPRCRSRGALYVPCRCACSALWHVDADTMRMLRCSCCPRSMQRRAAALSPQQMRHERIESAPDLRPRAGM